MAYNNNGIIELYDSTAHSFIFKHYKRIKELKTIISKGAPLMQLPFNPKTFLSTIKDTIERITSHVDSIDLNKIAKSYNIVVDHTYHTKIGGDDRLYASYTHSCEVEFDTYLNSFFILPESLYLHGYSNLYRDSAWQNFRDNAPLIKKRNIENFQNNYNKNEHISTLLHEEVDKNFRAYIKDYNDYINAKLELSKIMLELYKRSLPLHYFNSSENITKQIEVLNNC